MFCHLNGSHIGIFTDPATHPPPPTGVPSPPKNVNEITYLGMEMRHRECASHDGDENINESNGLDDTDAHHTHTHRVAPH
jgi:hypothetical protein